MRRASAFFLALATGAIVGAASCTFDTSPYGPQTGGSTSSSNTSSGTNSSTVATTISATTSTAVTTASASTTTGGGGCSDDTGAPVKGCVGAMTMGWTGTDNFASDKMFWTETAGASIGGGTAMAHGPANGFRLAPAFGFTLHECWVSIEVDTSSDDNGDALVDWGDPKSNDLPLQIRKNGALTIAGSTQIPPGTFQGVLRLREHNACVHIETVATNGTTWTEIQHLSTPNWFQAFQGGLGFGIEGAMPGDKVDFHNYNLPPIP